MRLPRLAAATVLVRALGRLPVTGAPAGSDVELAGVPGRLWRPARPRGSPILLAAGVTPAGPADPRIVRLAAALAAVDRSVFVPRLLLSDQRLDGEDVERIVRAVDALEMRSRRPPTVVGFSFGGSYSLLAAGDSRVSGRIRLVATFGAYGDLVGLLEGVTTGATVVDDEVVPWRAGRRSWGAGTDAILTTDFATILADRVGEAVSGTTPDAIRRVLAGDIDADSLPADARQCVTLLNNRKPRRVHALARDLPSPLPELLQRLSPIHHASDVRAPVLLVHAVDDPTVPFAEMRRLQRVFPDAATRPVHLFTHVDFVPTPRRLLTVARDLSGLLDLTAAVIGPP